MSNNVTPLIEHILFLLSGSCLNISFAFSLLKREEIEEMLDAHYLITSPGACLVGIWYL